MSLEMQKRASEFLTRWSRNGQLPDLLDSWTARVVAYCAYDGRRFDWNGRDAYLADRVVSSERELIAEGRLSYDTTPKDDQQRYLRELYELLKAMMAEET